MLRKVEAVKRQRSSCPGCRPSRTLLAANLTPHTARSTINPPDSSWHAKLVVGLVAAGSSVSSAPLLNPPLGVGTVRETSCPNIRGIHTSDLKKKESLSVTLTELFLVIPHTEKHVKLGNAALTLTYLLCCSVEPVSQMEFRTPSD